MTAQRAVSTRSFARLACNLFAGAAAFVGLAGSTWGSPILETHNDSLTKYLGGPTSVQGALPVYLQRGVYLDGSARAGGGAPSGWAIAGNPFGEPVSGNARLGSINLVTGTHEVLETDLALPAPGQGGWVVGRTYNAGQWELKGAPGSEYKNFISSDGYQGKNWFQSSQPEIQLFEGATDDKDLIYLVYGADRYVEFKRQGTSGTAFNTFKGVNGAAGVVLYTNVTTSGQPDTFTYYDQVGHRTVFFGFDADAGVAAGQIWKSIDTAGNTAFVGDATTGSTAISGGFDAGGRILKAYDAADRRYTYTYSVLDSVTRLTQVKAETKTGGTWASPTGVTEVGRVDYAYYQTGATTYGDIGNLRMVTVTTPLSPSGINAVAKKHYRYWTGAFDASTNPGHPDALKHVMGFEGTRRYDWLDSTLNDSFLMGSPGATFDAHSESYFEYDADHRIVEFWGNGQCGCSGAGNGTHTITYPLTAALGSTSGYSADIAAKTEVVPPASQAIIGQHFDKAGQPLSRVLTSSAASRWDSSVFGSSISGIGVARTSAGVVDTSSQRSNLTAYTDSQTTFATAFTRSASVGTASPVSRVASGDLAGLRSHEKWQTGTGGSANLSSTTEYTSASLTVGSVGLVRPMVSDRWSYSQETTTEAGGGSGPAGAYRTQYAYTMHTGDAALRAKQIDTTFPSVATGNNGSGSAAVAKATYRSDGRPEFMLSTDGRVGYTAYNALGQVVTRIVDANTTHADFTGVSIPAGFSSTGTANHLKTTYSYDAQGRLDSTTLPDGRVTKNFYTRLADQRLVTISVPRVVSGTTYYGPASYTVANHAGRVEVQGVFPIATSGTTTTIASWVANTSSDPISALHASTGGVKKLSTSVYDSSGTQLTESRSYFLVPASGTGTSGSNYDATTYTYDGAGRRTKTVDGTGTIEKVTYDARSRVTERWTGTDDGSPGNMEKIEALTYDGGSAGDGLLTSRTQYAGSGGTSARTTTYAHDARNRVVLTTNPAAPHSLVKYDNLGRVTASAQYSSAAGLTGTSDPTSATSNRLALSETAYDERGRAWKTTRHKINQSTGASSDTLVSQSWFDSEGRVIKTQGEQLTKTIYDRLGRAVRSYVLASNNDTTYAHASDVAGDVVMEESVTGYEASTGNALIQATVSRNWNDRDSGQTTGALDTNGDADDLKVTAANVVGRVQITAMWYDALSRLTDTAHYGTNNGADLNRTGLSVPARSDTVLVTSTTYNTLGLPEDVTDPRGLVGRTIYDDAGRRIAAIANYVNGTPSGPTGDDDVHTRYAYTAGLQTKMWADLDGDNVQDSDDQVTTYTFGVTKGTGGTMDSAIASNRLLKTVAYPDSTGGTDVVTYAYNALGQQKAVKDQSGNIITSSYDNAGRLTIKTVDTLASGFDGAVRRVEYLYDGLGRQTDVTQYDATTGSNVTDQVRTTYDDWGNPSEFHQDHDSTIGGTGTVDWSVRHTFAKNAPASGGGRQTVRATAQDLYRSTTSKQSVAFSYLSTSGRHDDALSRVSKLTVSSVDVASYEYLGAGRVANVRLDAVSVFSGIYDPADAAGVYSNIDRFGRVTAQKWTKDLSTDRTFYHVTNSYDRNSNITLHDDQIYPTWDSSYTVDGLNRLTSAGTGTWNGTAITSGTRNELWNSGGLDQLGNWKRYKLDLNNDGDWSDPNEMDDSRTFNTANELTARDTDTNGTANHSPTYDAVGNMTDDGKAYKLEYDAFGRMRFIKDRVTNAVIEEFRYSGLNHRIGWHYDSDGDSDVDANDTWYYFVYDRQWRMVATVRNGDTEAKELFVNHQAGANGMQTGLPLDAVALRDRHTSTWSADASGSSFGRAYYCQNFIGGRGDVVAVLASDGKLSQQVRYSAYGVPTGIPAGDTNADGSIVATPDITQMNAWIGTSEVRGDLDLDGDCDSDDMSILTSNFAQGLGWNKLSVHPDSSLSGVKGGHRKGYCGYEHSLLNHSVMHVRHRVYFAELGRWTRRDPLGYVDGMNVFHYCKARVLSLIDPTGTTTSTSRQPSSFPDGLSPTESIEEIAPPIAFTCKGRCTINKATCSIRIVSLMLIKCPFIGPPQHPTWCIGCNPSETYENTVRRCDPAGPMCDCAEPLRQDPQTLGPFTANNVFCNNECEYNITCVKEIVTIRTDVACVKRYVAGIDLE